MQATHFISCSLKHKNSDLNQVLNDWEFMSHLGRFTDDMNPLYDVFESLETTQRLDFLETMSRLLPLSTKIFSVLIDVIEDEEELKILLKNAHKNYIYTLKESIGYSKYMETFEDMRAELLEINKTIETLNGEKLQLSKTLVKQSKHIETIKEEIEATQKLKESNHLLEQELMEVCKEMVLIKNSNDILQKNKNKKMRAKVRLMKVQEGRREALNEITLECSEMLKETRTLGLEDEAYKSLLANLRTANNRAEFLKNEIALHNNEVAKKIENKLETIILEISALASTKPSLEEMILRNRIKS